jgi:transcriptional regulator with XRE-family HTH domain
MTLSRDPKHLGKRPSYVSRFDEVLRLAVVELIGDRKQTAISDESGVGQSTLSPQLSGDRPITLETLDKIAIGMGLSVAQVMTLLRDIALKTPSAVAPPLPATKIAGTTTAALATGDDERQTRRGQRSSAGQEGRSSARKRARLVKKQRP